MMQDEEFIVRTKDGQVVSHEDLREVLTRYRCVVPSFGPNPLRWEDTVAGATKEEKLARAIPIIFSELRSAWEHGMFGAIIDGLELCRKYSQPLPDWLAEVVIGEIRGVYAGTNSRRNIKSNDLKRWRHWWRYRAVDRLLSEREYLDDLGLRIVWTDNQIFRILEIVLEGTPAAGTADAIKKSYELVKRTSSRAALRTRSLTPPE